MRAYLRFVAIVLVACGARPQPVKPVPRTGDEIALYRDTAVVKQRFELDVPAASATVRVTIPAGVDQLVLLDPGGLAIPVLHRALDPAIDAALDAREPAAFDDSPEDVDDPLDAQDAPPAEPALETAPPEAAARGTDQPTELPLDVVAPRPGRYTIVLGYTTDRLAWDVAYTMTTTPARDRGELRGALAIRNDTGIVLRPAHTRLVDAELGPWRGKQAEELAAALVGGDPSEVPAAVPRELGALELGIGETRVELMAPATRPMRSVLVYDPIGTKLDNPGATPLRDVRLGLDVEPSPRISESFEIARDIAATTGLPAGPVRLLERRPGGALAMLGESRMFEATARVADLDTIAVGTAQGVTGARERRELTIDDENRRIVEEIVITLDNRRARPAAVLVREHLYRGQNWTLAYHSATAAAKEGAQQIALRAEVPARSQLKILYVVVYTWGP